VHWTHYRKLAAVLTLGVWAAGCTSGEGAPPSCAERPHCNYATKLTDATEFLRDFRAEGASNLYEEALAIADAQLAQDPDDERFNRCDPLYGMLMGRTQELLEPINNTIETALDVGLLDALTGGAGGLFAPSGTFFPTQAFSQDLLQLLENSWDANFQRAIDEIRRLSDEILAEDEVCVFQPGQLAPVTDPETDGELLPQGVTFRLGNNTSPEELAQNEPNGLAIDIQIGQRWDEVELRLLRFLIEFADGLAKFVFAHDGTLDADQLTQLEGFAEVANAQLQCTLGSSRFFSDEEISTVDECLAAVDAQAGDVLICPTDIRRCGFLVGDNPNTLARGDTWNTKINAVDNHLGDGFAAVSTLFPTMVSRTVRHGNVRNLLAVLEEYAIRYVDNNDDGVVNEGDVIGLDLVGVDFHFPPALRQVLADALGVDPENLDQAIENLISVALPLLQLSVESDQFVDTIERLVVDLRDQFRAVDDASLNPDRIRFAAAIQPLLNASGLFDTSTVLPDALELDLAAFFIDPVPLRELLPYWEGVFDTFFASETTPGQWVNHFIVETEIPVGAELETRWQVTGDTGHFDPNGYLAFDPVADGVNATDPNATLSREIPGADIPSDCMTPDDFGNVPYFFWQDPTFNDAVFVNTRPLSPPCGAPGETQSFQPGTLYTVHRLGIAYLDWFSRNFTLLQLIGGN